MADPLTIGKAIPTVIEATTKIIIYISKAKNASKTCRKLEIELRNTKQILEMLHESTDQIRSKPQSELRSLQWLGADDGLLSQIRSTLEEIRRKFEKTASSKGLKRFGESVSWPFNEDEAKAVLDTVLRQKADLMLIYGNDALSLLQDNKKAISSLLSTEFEKCQKDLCNWLSPFNFRARQSDLYQIRADTTGNWILENTDYIAWVCSGGTNNYLLCEGSPGAGKTIIASVIAQNLFSKFPPASSPGICIFCSYKDSTLQTLTNLLGSAIRQIIGDHGDNKKLVYTLYEDHKLEKDPSYRSLHLQKGMTVLKCMLRSMRRLYIVVDAIDECKDEDMRLEFLKILRGLGSNVSLLITSRPGFVLSQQDAVHVEIKAPDNDLEKYVASRMLSSNFLRKHTENDVELRDFITTTVVQRSDHMFLMAALYMDELSHRAHKNKRAVRQGLQSLPLRRNELYDLTFSRIEDQDATIVECAKQVLSWIVFAPEPLSIRQIQQALATREGDFALSKDSMVEPDLLTRICCGFISLGSKDGLLRASHNTAQDYLERNLDKLLPEGPVTITQTCLDYLIKVADICSTARPGRPWPWLWPWLWRDWGTRWPLAKDALIILRDHVEDQRYHELFRSTLTGRTFIACQIATDALGLNICKEPGLRKFCEAIRYPKLSRRSWGASLDPKFLSRIFLQFGKTAGYFSILHTAARDGADGILTLILSKISDIDGVKDPYRQMTALALACESGHSATVEILLQAGSDPNFESVRLPKPLYWALNRRHTGVAEKLLNFGADPTTNMSSAVAGETDEQNPFPFCQHNSFEYLALNGSTLPSRILDTKARQMMLLLKTRQNDVYDFGDVLCTAIRHSCKLTTIEFLLDLGFDPIRKITSRSALQHAIDEVSHDWHQDIEPRLKRLALLLERTPQLIVQKLVGHIKEVFDDPTDDILAFRVSRLTDGCEILQSSVLSDAVKLFASSLPIQTRCFVALVLLQKPGCDVIRLLSDYNLQPLEVLKSALARDSPDEPDYQNHRCTEGMQRLLQAIKFSPEDLDEAVWSAWSKSERFTSLIETFELFEPCPDTRIGSFAITKEFVTPSKQVNEYPTNPAKPRVAEEKLSEKNITTRSTQLRRVSSLTHDPQLWCYESANRRIEIS